MTNLSLDHAHDTRCWWHPEQARWVCSRPSAHTPTPQPDAPLVDVRDMLVVHTALLREFRLAAVAVARTSPDDRRQVRRVAAHIRLICDVLHHHHAGEDALLWPVMRPRVTAAVVASIEHAEGQHAEIDAAVARVTTAVEAWLTRPEFEPRDALAAHLTALHDVLRAHLELEERALLPSAAAVLTPQEWHAIGDAAVAALPKPVLPLVFGMLGYEADPAVLRTMLAQAPAVPRRVLPRIAPAIYARRARRVHGTARH